MPLRVKLSAAGVKKLIEAGKTPRYVELETYQAYYEGTQYAGRVNFLDQESGTPMLERAPCIVDPIVWNAVESHVALAIGGNRFPQLLSGTSEDDSAFDPRFGLDPKASVTLDRFNASLTEQCGLQSSFTQAAKMAMAARSVALIFSYANGLPAVDCQWAKICTPTFDPAKPAEVIKLTIRYRFVTQFRDPIITANEWWPVVKEYLRVIDAKADTVYTPVEVWDVTDPGASEGGPTDSKTLHGFGFCPVRWYACMRPTKTYGAVDGTALHDNRCAQIDAINFALSARHSAALYSGNPQMVATGCDDSDDFGGGGRVARLPKLPGDATTEWDKALYSPQGASTGAIRKGVNVLWRINSGDAKVYLLTLPPGALEALDSDAKDTRAKLREALRYVYINPEDLTGSGDISGKTLAFVYANQINFVNQLRDDLKRNLFTPAYSMIYRMALAKSDGVYLPGLTKTLPILKKFLQTLSDGSVTFFAPAIKYKFGAFFEPSDIDEATRADVSIKASTSGLITDLTAIDHVKEIFGIANADQYLVQLNAEKAAKAAVAAANANALAVATSPADKAPPTQAAPAAAAQGISGAQKPAQAPNARTAQNVPSKKPKKGKAK